SAGRARPAEQRPPRPSPPASLQDLRGHSPRRRDPRRLLHPQERSGGVLRDEADRRNQAGQGLFLQRAPVRGEGHPPAPVLRDWLRPLVEREQAELRPLPLPQAQEEEGLERGQRREALEARDALVGRADGRERSLLEVPVRPEALTPELASLGEHDKRALCDLALAQLQWEKAFRDLERSLRRREEDLVAAGADPQRPPDAARQEHRA